MDENAPPPLGFCVACWLSEERTPAVMVMDGDSVCENHAHERTDDDLLDELDDGV